MYVITGASGNIGSQISKLLLSSGKKVKAITRTKSHIDHLLELGAEASVGELEDQKFLASSFQGAKGIFAMIPPNYNAEDITKVQRLQAENLVKAIQNSGVKNVVALSSIGAHLADGTGVIKGIHYLEKLLNQLEGVNVLIIRPGYFMENLLANVGLIKHMGVNGSAVNGDLLFPMVATKDVAQLAFQKLESLDFIEKNIQYVLGPKDVSFNEVTKILGSAIGIEQLSYVQFAYEDAQAAMTQAGFSQSAAAAMVEFVKSLNEGFIIEPGIRNSESTTATTIEDFSKVFASAFQQEVSH